MEMTFMYTENSKTNEPQKFVLNMSQKLDIRSSNKHFPLQNVSIYLHVDKYKKQYKNNKLKIAPT